MVALIGPRSRLRLIHYWVVLGITLLTICPVKAVASAPSSDELVPEDTRKESCTKSEPDCRTTFHATFYSGVGIDTFAASELKKYLNPNDSSDVRERGVAGFNFEYRLKGSSDEHAGANNQLWIFGETLHGLRSTDVDCKANPDLAVCKSLDLASAPERTLFILRNATSLEAFLGVRYEFYTFQRESSSPANLYLKAEAGFLTVSGGGGDVVDNHHVGLGVMATRGRNQGSYVEVGVGKNDLFVRNPNRRLKVDGFLTWQSVDRPIWGKKVWPFAQFTLDSDLGPGADSVQTYIGFDLDLDLLFPAK